MRWVQLLVFVYEFPISRKVVTHFLSKSQIKDTFYIISNIPSKGDSISLVTLNNSISFITYNEFLLASC